MSFQALEQRAQRLAAQEWQAGLTVSPALAALSYDEYRAIRFDPARALWREQSDFQVQFFHPGFLFDQTVRVHEVGPEGAELIPFAADLFQFAPPLAGAPAEIADGYAGFRVHYPIKQPDVYDEFLVFLGAAYFRLIGQDQIYGLSARGLALGTGGPAAEEFPVFREFWLQRPAPDQRELVVLAILDSPSLAGAYRFRITPGASSAMDIEATLFARRDLDKPGIAPLTSMYTHGDTGPALVDDFRPRVHDSDGLLVISSRGEAQWRPLSNRARVRFSAFLDDQPPQGFGLLQRRRALADYEDLEAHYHRRPGKWIEPLAGDWGAGHVELVEIPTADETHDNIVAFWVPDRPIRAGERRHFHYRLSTVEQGPTPVGLARVVATHTGRAGIPGQDSWRQRRQRRFVIDFQAQDLPEHGALALMSETSAGEIREARLERHPAQGRVRAVIALDPSADDTPSDLRVWLQEHGKPMSEVWTYVWYPDELNRQL